MYLNTAVLSLLLCLGAAAAVPRKFEMCMGRHQLLCTRAGRIFDRDTGAAHAAKAGPYDYLLRLLTTVDSLAISGSSHRKSLPQFVCDLNFHSICRQGFGLTPGLHLQASCAAEVKPIIYCLIVVSMACASDVCCCSSAVQMLFLQSSVHFTCGSFVALLCCSRVPCA